MSDYRFETLELHVGQEHGIRPNTIRLSIGTEHIDDILEDLESAFAAVGDHWRVRGRRPVYRMGFILYTRNGKQGSKAIGGRYDRH